MLAAEALEGIVVACEPVYVDATYPCSSPSNNLAGCSAATPCVTQYLYSFVFEGYGTLVIPAQEGDTSG